MTRTVHQRRAYALRRVSLAVDRFIVARTLEAKAQASAWASAWANAWAHSAGVRQPSAGAHRFSQSEKQLGAHSL